MRRLNPRAAGRGGVLAGCLIALGVVIVLVVIGVIIVAMNWRSWASKGVRSLVEAGVTESSLPAAEQQEIMAVVDSFAAEFEAGDVSAEQVAKVLEELTESPMLPAMIVAGVQSEYIDPSALSDEEKAEGSKDLIPIRIDSDA